MRINFVVGTTGASTLNISEERRKKSKLHSFFKENMGAQASKQATRRLPRQANPETLSNRPAESPSTVRQQQQQQDPSFEKPLEG